MSSCARLHWYVVTIWMLTSCVCYAGQHPVVIDEDSACLDCHADHGSGAHVHAAVKMGCGSCHRVESRGGASFVALKPTKSNVCLECHQRQTFSDPHFPYASGMCTRCHDPHTSSSAHLLRAKVNELCLECHAQQNGRDPSRYMPTISLTGDNRLGHPYARHPVSGTRDPLTGEEMSCISCHLAHGSVKLHHLKMASAIPEDALNQTTETSDLCQTCHARLWGIEGAAGKKKKKAKTR